MKYSKCFDRNYWLPIDLLFNNWQWKHFKISGNFRYVKVPFFCMPLTHPRMLNFSTVANFMKIRSLWWFNSWTTIGLWSYIISHILHERYIFKCFGQFSGPDFLAQIFRPWCQIHQNPSWNLDQYDFMEIQRCISRSLFMIFSKIVKTSWHVNFRTSSQLRLILDTPSLPSPCFERCSWCWFPIVTFEFRGSKEMTW